MKSKGQFNDIGDTFKKRLKLGKSEDELKIVFRALYYLDGLAMSHEPSAISHKHRVISFQTNHYPLNVARVH